MNLPGNNNEHTATGIEGGPAPKLVFLFTGQGAQHIGMGKALYEAHPFFRMTMKRCSKLLEPYLEKPLLKVVGRRSFASNSLYAASSLLLSIRLQSFLRNGVSCLNYF